MKTINFKLSSGIEIELSNKDMEELKPLIDSALANLDVNLYERLKKSESKIITETLEKMNDLELIEFARIHDAQTVMNMLHLDSFSKKIYSELFKRAGIGFKQVSHLSFKQRNYLKELGLKSKNDNPL
ncbi:hypothetical protein [Chryseobacterium indoltheticum]|uniref:Uncharacterized protein n=1 Tax=Chryseobacterium indoltheticum TaxID=254 RepID=A0A381FAG9_9FLAO|nr:hypothetical protein [Chryseobacterium indoltheticum]AZA73591.1 hypothetical protein EG358_07395 [Chryseobacterium indoltheticum]SIR23523.1 hypothetical protein SAMN05421682_11562 [Chryseobacterium indoltheticum]SUX43571.1 Uncharacterised protein [Chryseobacterium indoltheticum]